MDNSLLQISPVCDQCGSELTIQKVIVNRSACSYEIHAECILYQHEVFYLLTLTDFINLERLLNGGGYGKDRA